MTDVLYKKNYLRVGLETLVEKANGKPMAFQGIFRTDRIPVRGRYFVSNIKLYSECSSRIYMLTSHVMLAMPDDMADMLRDNKRTNKPMRRKVVFIGYIYHYVTDGIRRCGIKLSFDITDRPIWIKREKEYYLPLMRYCYHPDLIPFLKMKKQIEE